ncbi:MAG: XkdX family protein [Clostridiales bacterium]|nr:XkdX family protein [Clostridiales bacterium]
MTNKDMAAANYARGLWTDDMLARLVEKGRLTTAEYQEITGTAYPGADKADTSPNQE